jgi:hypothetical protein
MVEATSVEGRVQVENANRDKPVSEKMGDPDMGRSAVQPSPNQVATPGQILQRTESASATREDRHTDPEAGTVGSPTKSLLPSSDPGLAEPKASERQQEFGTLSGSSVRNRIEEAYIQVSLSEGVDSFIVGQTGEEDTGPLGQGQDLASSEISMAPLESYAGHNLDMQLVQKIPEPINGDMTAAEKLATARMKEFCARILKSLAPPLLREVESMSSLRAAAEPFTPRRSTRFNTPASRSGKAPRKASAAESALLKALGVSVDCLSADEDAIKELKQLFDSPLRDRQLHVLAAIFGKTMPARDEILHAGSVEISVSA